MIRHFSLLALFCLGLCLTGCGSGGEAKYDPSKSKEQTQEELDEAADYEKMMAEQAKENEDSGN